MGQKVGEYQGIWAISETNQDFNADIVPASAPKNYRLMVSEGAMSEPDFMDEPATNEGEATGSEYSTNASKARNDVSGSANFRLTFPLLGFLAHRGFGVTGTPTTLAPGVYQQEFSLLNPFTNRKLPYWTAAFKPSERALAVNDIHSFKYRGCAVESLSFSSPKDAAKPHLRAALGWRGSGKRESAADINLYKSPSHIANPDVSEEGKYIPEVGKMKMYIGVGKAGTTFEFLCDFIEAPISIENTLDTENGYNCAVFQDPADPNSAQIRGEMDVVKQNVGVSFLFFETPEIKDQYDYFNAQRLNLAFSADWTYKGSLIGATYNRSATFSLLGARVRKIERTTYQGFRAMRVDLLPQAQSNVMPLTLKMVTEVPNFANFIA